VKVLDCMKFYWRNAFWILELEIFQVLELESCF
jgi:hypothetical protein